MQDYFKQNGLKHIDYKDLATMRKFLSPQGKIMSRKRTGLCSKNQRKLATAVKHARFLALLPYIQAE
jgi:small subunit ribosomal protein S18